MSVEMDSSFECCRDEKVYQRQFVLLLAEVRRRPELPTVVSLDILAFSKDFGCMYYEGNRLY